ncbi:hypothetical protein S99_01369 [Enterococcus faecalis EnGen0089]|uniref:Uncharacterized protein n=4 Tax=Enterococcus faecalis TaxID=1351 RepID=Q838W5_ENTFA|nr:hypothetical protein [Enterococcus faecalis]HBL3591053.1 hypothetical protein [Enterococcus faecium]AAO80181.1 hypothetical protein EF_0318 [Enterococcus faecalis V583]EFU86265.1 hypothetical protein HMPREF9507_02365 [Enterococcus faecalis TX0309B]EFU94210.1 hypothetical protein HMPREF9506_01007 [Enterococcus faecalis TX0309A]EOE36209.1 hypothetical protein QAM_02810 [Enterococcus faecalis EnGen0070]
MANIYLNIEADSAQELKEILSQLATDNVVEVTQSLNTADKKATEEVEKAAKKEPAKKKKATAKKKEEVSTASTSDTEPSKTGEKVAPTDSETEEVSATADLHLGATKADVQEAMRKAMDKGKRPMIKTCFSRYNAEKLSDLKEEHYGKFITDLETLVGE